MTDICTKFLFRLTLQVGAHHVVGATPFGNRRVAPIAGGTFEGPELAGTVLPGGTDWITEDAAGAWFRINVQVPLRTHDGELLTMAYQGFRSGPPEVLAKVSRGEPVDADSYYYRVSGSFETASARLARLNTLVAVAKGWRTSVGPGYDVFEVL
ncbi:uncharacterized protein DUF3237 [Trinickia symbiotica]|nr:DUF3237 domain-containing protein [Trinickia symbiotica]PPK41747.1 uncharacterized protein DUF3237 [Trinickia symbiotica]